MTKSIGRKGFDLRHLLTKRAGHSDWENANACYTSSMNAAIGDRVLACINEQRPERSHRDIASSVGMTPDAFSRALSGQRAFSSIELARLSNELSADVHWLITGEVDPTALRVAARHFYDQESRTHLVPGRGNDESVLNDIGLAYRQAYGNHHSSEIEISATPSRLREQLGVPFVRDFIDRVEGRLGIDVIRVKEISTSYSVLVGRRRVIVVPASGNWFYENFCIAHELGHLAWNDLDAGLAVSLRSQQEARASKFAADLLMPAEILREVNWKSLDERSLAQMVWDLGVSIKSLLIRLNILKLPVGPAVQLWAERSTQRLIRECGQNLDVGGGETDHLIAQRMIDAARRRFPVELQEAHLKRVSLGELGKGTLAWMIGVDSDALEVDVPVRDNDVDAESLAEALGL